MNKTICLLLIIPFLFISCIKKTAQYEQPKILQNNSDQNNSNNSNTESRRKTNERIQINLNTEPEGAYVFFEDGNSFVMTPVILNLELKEYNLRIERLRYYPEELVININDIKETENNSIQIKLRKNIAFTEDHYLSYSSRSQADGIEKEFRRYIYSEDSQLIRIDRYMHFSYYGYYNITLDNYGNIKTEQYFDLDGESTGVIEHFEYNDKNQLIRSWSSGSKWTSEYFYKNDVLERQVSQNTQETFIFDYIVEIENGSFDSKFTKKITQKYFYPSSTEEERRKDLANDSLPRTIYTYQ